MLSVSVYFSLIFLATTGLFSLGSASCFPTAQNESIGFFSKAPLAYGITNLSPSECAEECHKTKYCAAWLYIIHVNECQFYRAQPVAKAKSAGFILGSCDTTSHQPSQSVSRVPSLSSSSSIIMSTETGKSSLHKV
ncbi:hypothetical protein F1880_007967 [Penicillium rolfsii]|nr:hypothetical protein F1880_007967 [Penicillium rolfsii]